MTNPYSFIDEKLKIGFKLNLHSHNLHHTSSNLTIIPNHPEFGIEVRYINKIKKELAVIYARLINQYKFKYQTVFSARFDEQDEDNQVLDETELFINLNINHNLTQSDLDNIDVVSQLDYQTLQQEMKESGWRFDKINSMTIYFYQTGIMNGSSYIKIPLRSNAILNVENSCFLWSIIASLHLCNKNHPNRVSNFKHYFNDLNIQGFDFTNGFKCSDVHKFNNLNNLSVNIFELNFYQDHNKKFICRQCLSSYTSENM